MGEGAWGGQRVGGLGLHHSRHGCIKLSARLVCCCAQVLHLWQHGLGRAWYEDGAVSAVSGAPDS